MRVLERFHERSRERFPERLVERSRERFPERSRERFPERLVERSRERFPERLYSRTIYGNVLRRTSVTRAAQPLSRSTGSLGGGRG